MKKLFTALALAAALSACAPGIDILGAPAPLQKTVIDEKALLATWSAFDVALTAVDGLIAVEKLKPGSPAALEVKKHIRTAQNGLNAATAAQKAGSAGDYLTAMNNVREAMKLASAALKGL